MGRGASRRIHVKGAYMSEKFSQRAGVHEVHVRRGTWAGVHAGRFFRGGQHEERHRRKGTWEGHTPEEFGRREADD